MNNNLEVLDLLFNKLAILTDNSINSARKIQEDLSVNGVDRLSFILPLSSDKWKYLLNENLVKYKDELYFIKTPNFSHSTDTKELTVECFHLSTGLEGILCPMITEEEGIGRTARELVTLVVEGLVDTGWSVGEIDAPSGKRRSIVVKEQSVFTNLVKIAELFNAQLSFTAKEGERKVHLKERAIDRGVEIRKGKNLQSINVEYDTSEMATVLNVFGGTHPITGLEVNIFEAYVRDIEGNLTSQQYGKSYIEDYSYFISQGYAMDYIKAHPELFHKEITWNATEYLDNQQLYDDAIEKMKKISKPKVRASIEGVDLEQFPEYFVQSPIKGEIVTIHDYDLGISMKAQVDKIKKDSDKKIALRIELTNEIEYNSIIKQMVDASQSVNKVMTYNTNLNAKYLRGVMDIMSAKLNSTASNWYTDDQGNIVFENVQGTKAMKLGGGIFGISNNKNLDGSWDWTTFGDGSGFTADLIIAGILKGGYRLATIY